MTTSVDNLVNLILESDEYLTELIEKLIAEGIKKHDIIKIVRDVPGIIGKKRSKI